MDPETLETVMHGLREANLKLSALQVFFNGAMSEEDKDRFDPNWVLSGLEDALLEIQQAVL